MGCDIHLYLEGKKHVNGIEKWVCADLFKLNSHYQSDDKYVKQYEHVSIYSNRNYKFFAKLADVRNWDDEIKPISKPKGIPDDCCDVIKKDYEFWEDDAHSMSYFSLGELQKHEDDEMIQEIIKLMFQRADETLYFYKNYLMEHPDKLRIVFWFDN